MTQARPVLDVLGVVDERPPAWVVLAVDELARDARVEVHGAVAPSTAHPGREPGIRPLWRLYTALDRRFTYSDPDAWRILPSDAVERPMGMGLVELGSALVSGTLDLVLWLSLEPPPALLEDVPLWRCSFGNRRPAWSPSALLHDMRAGRSLLTVSVVESDDRGHSRLVAQAGTRLDRVSWKRNHRLGGWKASDLVVTSVRRRAAEGCERDATSRLPDTWKKPGANPHDAAGPPRGLLPAIAVRAAGRGLARLATDESWVLGIRRRPDSPLAPGEPFRLVRPPRSRSWADPFLFERDGEHHLFFEEIAYRSRRGRIMHACVGPDGRLSAVWAVLERPYHLSSPFLFEHEGQVYLMPETGQERRLELYRAVSFPGEWVLDRVLLTGVYAVDASMLRHAGRWWLFVARPAGRSTLADQLSLFMGHSPLGPWEPHPCNPVVQDIRTARPAGRVFGDAGSLIRPSQDGARRYGEAVVLNRIERLDERGYRERPIRRVTWDRPGIVGTHTVTFDGAFEVVDGVRRVPRAGRSSERLPRPSRGETST